MFSRPLLLSVLASIIAGSDAASPSPSFFPARPPAIPLAVRSPYTSVWSSKSKIDDSTEFWTGDGVGWEGIIRVDGVSYEWLGSGSKNLPSSVGLQKASTLNVTYDSQYSNFTIAAGPVELSAAFFSPVVPRDYCRTSIPLSYLTISVRSTDNNEHKVQLHNDVNGQWIGSDSGSPLEWELHEGSGAGKQARQVANADPIFTWRYGQQNPHIFGENRDSAQWGSFTLSSAKGGAENMTHGSGHSINLRNQFIAQGGLPNNIDPKYRGSGSDDPVFAFAHDLGSVGGTASKAVTYTIGSIQEPVMTDRFDDSRYLTPNGVLPLQPWWSKCYGDMWSMIYFHYNDLAQSQQLASQWDAQLKTDIATYYQNNQPAAGSDGAPADAAVFDSGDGYGYLDKNNVTGKAVPDVKEQEAYYSIVALSARQVMGAYVLAVPPKGTGTASEPLLFQKEISTGGPVNTVDLIYPAMPFLLYADPKLLKFLLEPLLQNQESGFYPNSWASHDLGNRWPNATGHMDGGDTYMPIEETGNMIIMAYAYAKFSGDTAFLTQHYAQLKKWSTYMNQTSLHSSLQLSTDAFAGPLINQTNLAVKGIVALAAMREVATLAGNAEDSAAFAAATIDLSKRWETLAVGPGKTHVLLSYQHRSSYGLLYNLYPDKLLGLKSIPDYIYDMQSAFYPTISQAFGIPLDSRHQYTKTDWQMWTAATCSPSTRALFVTSLAKWINEGPTDRPMTDWYDTTDGGFPPGDQDPTVARPVVGGHFSLLALAASQAH